MVSPSKYVALIRAHVGAIAAGLAAWWRGLPLAARLGLPPLLFLLIFVGALLRTLPSAGWLRTVNRALASDASYGRTDSVAARLAAGANPNVRGPGNRTPLLLAVEARDTASVRLLLAAGADPHVVASNLLTPLTAAIFGGDTVSLQLMLDAGVDPNTFDGAFNEPAVSAAVQYHSIPALRILVQAGADVNRSDSAGLRPLDYALVERRAPLLRELVRLGANPDLQSPINPARTVRDVAREIGDPTVLRALRR